MTTELAGDFLLVYAVVFGFELVDRTNFAVITLSTRHHHGEVWVGAALAFLVSTSVAILVGWLVISYLLPYVIWVRLVGGTVLIVFGLKALFDHWRHRREPPTPSLSERLPRSKVVATAFSLILLLEMGDNTQVLTILFATQMPLAVVFFAAFLALVSVAVIGSFSGRFLKDRVPEETLHPILGAILVVVGTFTVAWALGWLPIPEF